ncbi:MAG TPA: siroheme synthase CysG [Caulobacteraceae bacterium]|jgi:uroporphyrin-III C-methyltransferase/precorrin-2 dehydrogenase/sirohydrochlorin ferrochelatase|nr:siroheme synthase CysG [Caulobacteraceae bacterium]
MRSFLASIPLDGRAVVVVGSGDAAVAKARLAAKTPAEVRWFAPDGAPAERERPAGVEPIARAPEDTDFANAALVFIAVDDPADAAWYASLANASGALVNVVDRPQLSDFHTPALIDRGDVVIGVATGGAAPVLARDIRARIEAALPVGVETLGRVARELRETVKASAPQGVARRRFWERAFRGRAAEAADANDAAAARREVLRELNAPQPQARGFVWLVGAGPGDPELLTLKALRLIQNADVIVHDRLVPEAILDFARRDARRIDVGKSKGDHPVPQDEIERILIDEARKDQRVVRLKGGDPFVFGRGGEELEALKRAGVETEVVPGITSALACAAAAEVPLTHRDHAQAVTFVTGHGKRGADQIDWAALSSPQHTLAIYMGAERAGAITDQLIKAGRDPQTPVAVVVNGARPGQRVVAGALHELELLVALHEAEGPSMIFVGRTARFAAAAHLIAEAAA